MENELSKVARKGIFMSAKTFILKAKMILKNPNLLVSFLEGGRLLIQ
jgi:hypothetical protein